MAADGSITISVTADDKEAQKRLNELRRSIEKTQNALQKSEGKHDGISAALQNARDEAEQTAQKIQDIKAEMADYKNVLAGKLIGDISVEDFVARRDHQIELTAQLSEQEKLYAQQTNAVSKLEEKEKNVTAEIERQKEILGTQKEEAGAIERVFAQQSNSSLPQLGQALENVNNSVKKGFKNILKWGFGIRSAFILMRRLRSAIKEGINTFAEYDDETRANIDGLKNSLTGLKASWGAAFAPILNAVAPILQKLISLLVTAANYVQMFFSVLRGGVSYKKVIANNDALAKSYGGAGSAAKEAKKQLMSFDEINKLDSNDSGGGGGGGGGGASPIEGVEDTLIPEDTLKKLQWVKDHLKEILAVAGAVGVAIAAWKIAGAAADILSIWKAFKIVLGVIMAIAGAVLFVKGYLDAWVNGVDWENLKQMLIGVALLVAGLGLAFGTTGLAIGLLVAGVAMLVLGFKEWIETGELSEETFTMMELAIMGVGIALSLLTGSWIPAVIAAVAMIVVAIVKNWDSIKAAFEGAWNWIKTTAKGWWDKVVTYVDGIKTKIVDKFEQIKQGIVDMITTAKNKVKEAIDKVKEFFNFKWELPHISLPHITVSWEPVTGDNPIAKLLGIGALPHFGIQWYAKGGIVDGATLFGAGEAGKEAVVPLERNTEWVGMVARGIVDSLTSDNRLGDYISGKVLPSVVSGQIVPPRALAGGGSMFTDGDIERLVNGITAALTANDGEEHTPVIIDGRVVAEIVTRHQRRMERGFA